MMTSAQNILVLAGRVLLAYLFITAGYPKLLDPAGTAGMISGAGLPAAALAYLDGMISYAGLPAATALAYLAGLFELVAGLAILVGFQTKIAALALAAFCVFTSVVFHSGTIAVEGFPEAALGWLNTLNGIIFVKNFALAGGFLVLAAFGAGAYSADAKLGKA